MFNDLNISLFKLFNSLDGSHLNPIMRCFERFLSIYVTNKSSVISFSNNIEEKFCQTMAMHNFNKLFQKLYDTAFTINFSKTNKL